MLSPVNYLYVDENGTTRGYALMTVSQLQEQWGDLPVYLGPGTRGATRTEVLNGQNVLVIGDGTTAE